MTDKKDLEGKKLRLPDFPGQVFTLTYAGWEDQWIVKNTEWVDMLRCSGDEVIPYLLPVGYADQEEENNIPEVEFEGPMGIFHSPSEVSIGALTKAAVEITNAMIDKGVSPLDVVRMIREKGGRI